MHPACKNAPVASNTRLVCGHNVSVCQSRRSRIARAPASPVDAAAAACQGSLPCADAALDDRLSNRWIDLDEQGYFIIGVRHDQRLLVAEHYSNTVNASGQACDPDTGEPLACSGGVVRRPSATYSGRTAKELSMSLLEGNAAPFTALRVDHANYLGRELQKAEFCLVLGLDYVQD